MATGTPGIRYGFVGKMLLIVGVTCLVAGSVLAVQELLFLRNSRLVQGYYTDEAGSEDSQGNMNFVYFIDFKDRSGKTITFNAYTRNYELPEHKPLLIRYDPNKPTAARLANEPSPSLPLLIFVMGVGFASVGGLLLSAEHRKRKAILDAPLLGA